MSAQLLRDSKIEGLRIIGPVHEWTEGRGSLELTEVEYLGRRGAVMFYSNPPVHQIGNPGLAAMLAALAALEERPERPAFLLLTWACDPVHAGGDLKESQTRLETVEARRAELEAEGEDRAQIEALYDWADGRLDKGQALYRAVRELSTSVRTIGVCGGGLRFGGSAEVNLMADYLVGDSRSGMCFSEAMIGLIPGWAGVGRAVTKAGVTNTRWMAQAAQQVMAADLKAIGIYDVAIEIDEPLPAMGRSGDKDADKAQYARDLLNHNGRVWPMLLLEGLKLGVCDADELRKLKTSDRASLVSPDAIETEVSRRADPETYRELWGKTLKEAREQLAELGRPLAPQSVAELAELLGAVDETSYDEDAFVEAEKQADARLYRDFRLAPGIRATLEQRVADFRETKRQG